MQFDLEYEGILGSEGNQKALRCSGIVGSLVSLPLARSARADLTIITLSVDNPLVALDVLESDELEGQLERLDDFEGIDYRRIFISVQIPNGMV